MFREGTGRTLFSIFSRGKEMSGINVKSKIVIDRPARAFTEVERTWRCSNCGSKPVTALHALVYRKHGMYQRVLGFWAKAGWVDMRVPKSREEQDSPAMVAYHNWLSDHPEEAESVVVPTGTDEPPRPQDNLYPVTLCAPVAMEAHHD